MKEQLIKKGRLTSVEQPDRELIISRFLEEELPISIYGKPVKHKN
jgi:hypothetical protein